MKLLIIINLLISSHGFINQFDPYKLGAALSKKKDYYDELEHDFDFNDIKKSTIKTKFKPRTPNQKKYNNDILNKDLQIVIGTGPAGCGKTLFASQYAAKILLENDKTKVILTRPLISVSGEDLGYLPGNLIEKMNPWIIPIFDILLEFMTHQKLEALINEKRLEIVPLAYMRGRTFKDCVIIADELQNSFNSQMLMLLTRLGENSKLLITGDVSQSDNLKENGLLDFIGRIEKFYFKNNELNLCLMKKDNISYVKMDNTDVQRSLIISTILNIYDS